MTSSVIQRLVQGRAQNDEFIAALEQARQQCRRAKNQTTLAMVEVRSASYHEAAHTGSEAALDMVAYIQSNLRNTDQVFPCGNQQVAILLSGTHIRNAVCLAERLRAQ